ncbi:hypothetical protein C4H11_03870 [Bacteroides zoogleoformans]|uniref:Uncharacterized protein n=1 Tax=Bacteroides zoogleoformans TaxID=28119 RepID=A0ABM6T6G0_9BACE|nr:hypothetical protein C4H11_03870 [Bacteroides zoogleoformans]
MIVKFKVSNITVIIYQRIRLFSDFVFPHQRYCFLGILYNPLCIKYLVFTVFDYLKNEKDLLTA